eukprot:ANDGO_06865.mRNA.1 hypothetical protein PHYSODRAFT_488630
MTPSWKPLCESIKLLRTDRFRRFVDILRLQKLPFVWEAVDLALQTRAKTDSASNALAALQQETDERSLNPLPGIQLHLSMRVLEEDRKFVEDNMFAETREKDKFWMRNFGAGSTLLTLEYGWERGIFDTLMHDEKETPEGVVHHTGCISKADLGSLNTAIDAFRDRGSVADYHPGSGNRVRNILHPSLFPYITKAETPSERETYAGQMEVKPGTIRTPEREHGAENDDFGRVYRRSRYQWMPSEVHVDDDGVPKFASPVNGVDPQRDADVQRCLESVLALAIPAWEHVLGYTKSMHWTDYQTAPGSWQLRGNHELVSEPVSLRGKRLQVIPKIADIQLKERDDIHEGVWHVEGLSHERIVATALAYLRKDEKMQDGSLLFRRSFTTDETSFVAWSSRQDEAATSPLLSAGLIPLGKLTPNAGDLVAFPNSHQHKLEPIFTSASKWEASANTSGLTRTVTRRVVAFFLVDPSNPIVSTADVVHLPDTMLSYEARCRIRLAMMAERSAAKKDLNEELSHNFNFCEH